MGVNYCSMLLRSITEIAETLALLEDVEYVDLGMLQLTGPLDSACGLARTKKLESLDLLSNGLTGARWARLISSCVRGKRSPHVCKTTCRLRHSVCMQRVLWATASRCGADHRMCCAGTCMNPCIAAVRGMAWNSAGLVP